MAIESMSNDWKTVVQEHAAHVFGAARRILGDDGDAEDVSQEVFLEAYRRWAQQPAMDWTPLLRRMATCRALDRLRRRKLTLPLHEQRLESSVPGPVEIAVGRELEDRLRDALTELPARESEVFWLHFFEDLPNKEIALLLEITPGAVAAACHKARNKLETLLSDSPQGARP